MATAGSVDASHEHGHDDDHGHGRFIAHHFESAEQQFDSSKLGMWLFLVQELLFFTGLFVAYTLLRNHHPEIFEAAHVFLNKTLGGVNTVVLLFSSLTMAWAVRCSQLEQHKGTVICLVITLVCAAVFLGIKAVEYSHKWSQGLFWAGSFDPGTHDTPYLLLLSIPFAIGLVACGGLSAFHKATKSEIWAKFFLGMAITFAGYFLGVGLGTVVEGMHSGSEHGSQHASLLETRSQILLLADDTAKADDKTSKDDAAAVKEPHIDDAGKPAAETGHEGTTETAEAHAKEEAEQILKQELGSFFSIYYIMTGLHALHIIGGVVVLAWLLYRALALHFRKDYFGPVENVGLYWHLVDLIWIFLFPLMYLIH